MCLWRIFSFIRGKSALNSEDVDLGKKIEETTKLVDQVTVFYSGTVDGSYYGCR